MPPSIPDDVPSLLDRVRRTCRCRQYSDHTEKAHVRWIVRYVRFHAPHPRRLGADDVRAFLTPLGAGRVVDSPLDALDDEGRPRPLTPYPLPSPLPFSLASSPPGSTPIA